MTWQVYRAASSDHGAWTNRPCRRACTAEDREAGDRVPTSAGDARGERFTGTCKRSPMLIADAASRYRAIARGDGPAYAQEHLSAGTYLAGPSGRHPQLLAQTLVARIRSSRERHRDYRGCCTAGGCAVRFVAVACWRAPTVAILRRRSPRCSMSYRGNSAEADEGRSSRRGRLKTNLLPRPGVLSAHTRPPWACTIDFTMNRPSPSPRRSRFFA